MPAGRPVVAITVAVTFTVRVADTATIAVDMASTSSGSYLRCPCPVPSRPRCLGSPASTCLVAVCATVTGNGAACMSPGRLRCQYWELLHRDSSVTTALTRRMPCWGDRCPHPRPGTMATTAEPGVGERQSSLNRHGPGPPWQGRSPTSAARGGCRLARPAPDRSPTWLQSLAAYLYFPTFQPYLVAKDGHLPPGGQ